MLQPLKVLLPSSVRRYVCVPAFLQGYQAYRTAVQLYYLTLLRLDMRRFTIKCFAQDNT